MNNFAQLVEKIGLTDALKQVESELCIQREKTRKCRVLTHHFDDTICDLVLLRQQLAIPI